MIMEGLARRRGGDFSKPDPAEQLERIRLMRQKPDESRVARHYIDP
jgi:hypothetical protein